jgi:hypothetical protein
MSDCTERSAAKAEGQEGMPNRLSMSDCTERGTAKAEGQEGMRKAGTA